MVTPSIVALARTADGAFVRGVIGTAALGPVRERLHVGAAGGIERLGDTHDAAGDAGPGVVYLFVMTEPPLR